MGNDVSDEDLMLKYRDGDYAALEILYQRHKQSLFRFMLRLCPNQGVTEELFQDVWMKLIDARSRYEVDAKFTTYLFQIARNRVIDHFRKHSTSSEINQADFNEVLTGVSDKPGKQPEQQIETDEKIDVLMQLIEELPHEQREVFIMKEDADLSINEIAAVINEKPEAVKSRLRYAFKKLRQGLNQFDE